MTDFLGPSQQAGQQLQGILQASNERAQDNRADLAERQFKQQQMAKNFEVKANLSNALIATDPEAALDMMNDGLRNFGVSLTMEQFRPAMKGFEVMADLTRNGDHQGAQGVLKSMKERGWLVNLQDQARAAELEQQNRQGLATQQANVIGGNQAESPGVARARESTSMLGMVGGDINKVHPDELIRVTGTADPTEQQNRVRLDQAIVEGYDHKQKTMQQLFALDPSAFGKAADLTASHLANPDSMAKWRVSELLAKPDRTPEEERELTGKASVYTPHLADALNLKSAARDKERLMNQLEDTRTRQSALTDHLGMDGQAEETVSSLQQATKGLPDAGTPLSDEVAKRHLLAEGTRTVQSETFALQAKPRIETLEQSAQEAERQRERLASMAVSALPGQRETIDRQMTEYASMAKANRAMARLLKEENPYTIAAQESDAALIDDPIDRKIALDDIATLKQVREKDIKLVQTEQERLKRRETILQGQMGPAERKEEQERMKRLAHASVDDGVSKGQPLAVMVREAADRFGVDKAELAKDVVAARGSGISEAQMALLSKVQEFKRTTGKEPAAGDINKMLMPVLKKYPGIKGEEVTAALKDPNRPLAEVYNYDPKQNFAEASKLANVNQAVQELQQVRQTFINPDGSVNRAQILGGAWSLPFTKGKGAAQFIEKAVEIKLRAATGAAARPDEMKMYGKLFAPSSLDSDEIVKYKLDSLENWMQTVAETIDPAGDLRKRAEALLDKGTIGLLSTPEYGELRSKFPLASTSEIVRFLQDRKKAKK